MPDPTTPAKGLTQPQVGGDNNAWGGLLNTDLSLIDTALGGTLTLSISGNTTLTTTQVENTGYKFAGALSGNATITWPGFSGMSAIRNSTTGGFSIACGISGAAVTIINGETVAIWSDGTDFVRLAATGGGATTPNSGLTNSSITIAGHVVSLGGTQALAASDLSNGTLGSGAIALSQAATVAETSNYTDLSADSGTVFHNTGATGEVDFSLPAASVGLTYTFIVQTAQLLKVIGSGSSTIAIGSSISATGGNIGSSTPYSAIRLIAISSTEWVTVGNDGFWDVT
jgi:hypothetical protein